MSRAAREARAIGTGSMVRVSHRPHSSLPVAQLALADHLRPLLLVLHRLLQGGGVKLPSLTASPTWGRHTWAAMVVPTGRVNLHLATNALTAALAGNTRTVKTQATLGSTVPASCMRCGGQPDRHGHVILLTARVPSLRVASAPMSPNQTCSRAI